MQIQILSVSIITVPTAKGSYQTADVAYKNITFQGKVEGKKVMSFGATKSSFETLATAQPGDTFDVNVVKNDKGYNDWVSMAKAGTGGTPSYAPPASGNAAPATATRSTYETAEERAKKQVFIVRQSAFNYAVSALAAGAKSPVKFEEALDYAKRIEGYVFGESLPSLEDMPSDAL